MEDGGREVFGGDAVSHSGTIVQAGGQNWACSARTSARGQKPRHPQAAPAKTGNPFSCPYAITAFTSPINITIPASKVISVSLTSVRVG